MTCTVLLAIVSLGACNGLAGNDEMERYYQRSETITLSAGDAMRVNAATHILQPWPPGVGDRRIAFDAQRLRSGIQRYRALQQPTDQMPNIGESGKLMGQPPPVTRNYNYSISESGSAPGSPPVSIPVQQ